eukprot:9489440-Pyramimonas_sp.AAC.2
MVTPCNTATYTTPHTQLASPNDPTTSYILGACAASRSPTACPPRHSGIRSTPSTTRAHCKASVPDPPVDTSANHTLELALVLAAPVHPLVVEVVLVVCGGRERRGGGGGRRRAGGARAALGESELRAEPARLLQRLQNSSATTPHVNRRRAFAPLQRTRGGSGNPVDINPGLWLRAGAGRTALKIRRPL